VLLALALLLAPLGICFSGTPAMAAEPHAGGMHHASPASVPHSSHGRIHFCPECHAPSFVKAGKTTAPDLIPSAAPIAPIPAVAALPPIRAKARWNRWAPSHPPPLRGTYRIRLRI
jgi:hypothetical protein